jgi:hypothetical protein
MLTPIEIGIMRVFEVLFSARTAGCVITVVASWYSILKETTN